MFGFMIAPPEFVWPKLKLVWQGFPAFLASVSDADRQTLPVAFAVASGEAANDYELVLESMKDGVEKLAGSPAHRGSIYCRGSGVPHAKRRVNWFHVRKNIEKHVRKDAS